MSIYSRDNINYQSLLDSMIRNRSEQARRDADTIRQQGQIWSGFVKDTGKMIGKGLDYYSANQEGNSLEDELAAKEAERNNLIRQYSAMEQQAHNPAANGAPYDRSYSVGNLSANPDNYYVVEPKGVYDTSESPEQLWLNDHPGKTHEDYVEYVNYMNSVWGGR